MPLVLGALGPEVDQHDPDAVERVVEHGADQADLHQVDERVLVGLDDRVVGLGRHPHQRGVQHVGEQEEEGQHTGDPVGDPRPHAGVAAVDRTASRFRHPLAGGECSGVGHDRSRPPASTADAPEWDLLIRLLFGGATAGPPRSDLSPRLTLTSHPQRPDAGVTRPTAGVCWRTPRCQQVEIRARVRQGGRVDRPTDQHHSVTASAMTGAARHGGTAERRKLWRSLRQRKRIFCGNRTKHPNSGTIRLRSGDRYSP